eukprot:TRINITY_DN27465_c0_g1_i1.p1 TRINITY_DN27465_c0_g1~~TRINITY_DN27465_c0_g1_i1.p1  ORF type:complete len:668 (+),score=121.95 TRINITY_DN27465_c0_g1_i1:85-2088(+)
MSPRSEDTFKLVRGPSLTVVGASTLVRCQGNGVFDRRKELVRDPEPELYRASSSIFSFSQKQPSLTKLPPLVKGNSWQLNSNALEELFNPRKKPEPKLPSSPSSPGLPTSPAPRSPERGGGHGGGLLVVPGTRTAAAAEVSPAPTPRSVSKASSAVPEEPVLDVSGKSHGAAPAQFPKGDGRNRPDFLWLRQDNSEPARAFRRKIQKQTRLAVHSKAYVHQRGKVELQHIDQMMAGTRTLTASSLNALEGGGKFFNTAIKKFDGIVLEAAADADRRFYGGERIAVVNAASAYHCGGGFMTGGRHALEEALCVQTTVYDALNAIKARGSDESQPYIPVDGVIISPEVDVIREGSDKGYPFLEKPLHLGALISVAMFNRNPRVRDGLVDAPDDPVEYEEGVRNKMRAILGATMEVDCSVLIIPDVGCGVFGNDPQVVGRILGEVLRSEFWLWVKEVYLTGKEEFKTAVLEAVAAVEEAQRAAEQRTSVGSYSREASGVGFSEEISEGSGSNESESSGSQSSAASSRTESSAAREAERPQPPPSPSVQHVLEAESRPDTGGRSLSPPPVNAGGHGRLCEMGCGRHVKGNFKTCCRTCGRTRGTGGHDAGCAGGAAASPIPSPAASPRGEIAVCQMGCGRSVKPGFKTCCRECGRTRGGGGHDRGCTGPPE